MTEYDFIIAGGGAAGLGLAYQMAASSLRGRSILVIERDNKDRNDRTWSFWSARQTPFEHLVYRSWDAVEVVSEDYRQEFSLAPYQYRMICGIDFYQGVRDALQMVPEVSFLKARVDEVSDTRDKKTAQVMVNDAPIVGRWAFDSRFTPLDYFSGPSQYHYLKQHFRGWEIETPVDTFNPRVVTMFDFRTPQQGCMRFFYILPFTKRRALVEYTLFSANLLKPHEYDRALSDYIEGVLKIPRYRTDAIENGIIPMTDRPFPRRLGERVMAIGTRGGLVKPSSGYAFLRIQNDNTAITRSLAEYGHPFAVPHSPWRYRLFDTIMLQVMHRRGNLMKSIFLQMFQRNSIQNIFRFLDEEASFPENVRLLASLPPAPFIKALFKVKLLRRV